MSSTSLLTTRGLGRGGADPAGVRCHGAAPMRSPQLGGGGDRNTVTDQAGPEAEGDGEVGLPVARPPGDTGVRTGPDVVEGPEVG